MNEKEFQWSEKGIGVTHGEREMVGDLKQVQTVDAQARGANQFNQIDHVPFDEELMAICGRQATGQRIECLVRGISL